MKLSPKILFPITIIAGAVIVLVFYIGSSKTDGSVTPSNTPTPSAQSVATKVYSDDKSGLSFSYPETYDLEKHTSAEGKEYIIIDPFNSDSDNRTEYQSARLLSLRFIEGTTLEKQIAEYSKKEDMLENVQMEDITINGIHGKRVSYTTPIGLNPLEVILPWNDSLLLVSVEANTEMAQEFEKIIGSVHKTK
jgi:hypothetical protein